MARTIIKSIDVLSLAKIYGLFTAVLAGVFGFLYGLGIIIFTLAGGMSRIMILAGIAIMVLAPVLYGAFGFIMGALSALVYNLLSKTVGGLELELGTKK